MKAAYIEETGPPENIVYGDLPDPTPSGTEVLVRAGAVAVNPIDTYLRGGANYWDRHIVSVTTYLKRHRKH